MRRVPLVDMTQAGDHAQAHRDFVAYRAAGMMLLGLGHPIALGARIGVLRIERCAAQRARLSGREAVEGLASVIGMS